MKKRSKRYLKLKKKVDDKKIYTLDEALGLIKETTELKFDATVEAHFNLNIDPRKADQLVRSSVILPEGLAKPKKIAVFAEGLEAKRAKEAGADIVGGEDLIQKIKTKGECNFDVALAHPTLMPKLTKIARILGQKGLMPSPRTETVTMNLGPAIKEWKKGKIFFRNDDTGNVHFAIGKVSWDKERLKKNFKAVYEALQKARPKGVKGVFIKTITLSSTMGPGFKIKI